MNFSKIILAAVMVAGSAIGVGCNAPAALNDAADKVAADAQPSDGADYHGRGFGGYHGGFRSGFRGGYAYRGGVVRDHLRYGYGLRGAYSPYYVRYAPPAARYEYIGRAPSARHFWVNGYHQWGGRGYNWVGGHWDVRRNGYTYVQPHYDVINGRHRFIPGHWA